MTVHKKAGGVAAPAGSENNPKKPVRAGNFHPNACQPQAMLEDIATSLHRIEILTAALGRPLSALERSLLQRAVNGTPAMRGAWLRLLVAALRERVGAAVKAPVTGQEAVQ